MKNNTLVNAMPAEWTSGRVNGKNTCIGTIKSGVSIGFCIKETNNAPVDIETCKTRIYAAKNPKSAFDPASRGYSEQAIQVTVPFTEAGALDEYESKVKWNLLGKDSVKGSTVYTFDVSLKTDSKEKQL